MNGSVIRGQRNGVSVFPSTSDTPPFVSVSKVDNDSSSVNLSAEGTIDWIMLGAITGPAYPYYTLNQNMRMRRQSDSELWKGFNWCFKNGLTSLSTLGGATARTCSFTLDDDQKGAGATSITNRVGYSTTIATALVNVGWRIALPTVPVRRRLKVYSVHLAADMTLTARAVGSNEEVIASEVVSAAAGITIYPVWTIDFEGPARGGMLVVEAHVTTQNASSANQALNAMTLAEAP